MNSNRRANEKMKENQKIVYAQKKLLNLDSEKIKARTAKINRNIR